MEAVKEHSVNMQTYVDKRIDDLEKLMVTNLTLDRIAVAQYSKTNDEWKLLHNGLQRKMEEDKNMFVTREMLDKANELTIKQNQITQSRLMARVAIIGLLISALMLALTFYVIFGKK